jgi:hypothetical protein
MTIDQKRDEILRLASHHGARNVRVDFRLVLRVVERDLPSLSAAVEALLTGTGASGPSGRVE